MQIDEYSIIIFAPTSGRSVFASKTLPLKLGIFWGWEKLKEKIKNRKIIYKLLKCFIL